MDIRAVLNMLKEKSVVPSKEAEELKRVTKEIYEKNLELSIRNRTFSILQKIYSTINTSYEVEDTAQHLINTIAEELRLRRGIILLSKTGGTSLTSVASSQSQKADLKIDGCDPNFFRDLSIDLSNQQNYCVRTYIENKERMTNFFSDVVVPYVDEKTSIDVANRLGILTSFIFPLQFANKPFGVIVICMDKHVGYLSRTEKEILREVIGVITIAIERSQIYADLKTANERLKEVDKLKDEFVSIASHELRTPMTAIKSYLWMALAGKGGELTEKQKYYLDRAYNSTDRLIKLVNDMLNISRIESGRMSFTMKEVDLKSLVETVVSEVKPRADELSVTIEINQSLETISHVLADEDKIDEVLINLIGNSLKFTNPGGKITISFAENNGFVTVSVRDTGAGIEPEDMPKLFSKFGLLPGSYTNNRNVSLGTGLGLYICKNIINIHGGEIKAESPGRNQGSIFSFSLSIFSRQKMEEFNAKYSKDGGKGIEHMQL